MFVYLPYYWLGEELVGRPGRVVLHCPVLAIEYQWENLLPGNDQHDVNMM